MRRDREQIIGAIHLIHTEVSSGLCDAFCQCGDYPVAGCPVRLVQPYLRRLGGRADEYGFFWPLNDEGKHQRLTFLAFMLAWEEDHANAN